jgi:hypothetical protein
MPDPITMLLIGYAMGVGSFLIATYTIHCVRANKPLVSFPKWKDSEPPVVHKDELVSRL